MQRGVNLIEWRWMGGDEESETVIKENKGSELGIPSWLQQLYLHPIITIIYSRVGNPFKRNESY